MKKKNFLSWNLEKGLTELLRNPGKGTLGSQIPKNFPTEIGRCLSYIRSWLRSLRVDMSILNRTS